MDSMVGALIVEVDSFIAVGAPLDVAPESGADAEAGRFAEGGLYESGAIPFGFRFLQEPVISFWGSLCQKSYR